MIIPRRSIVAVCAVSLLLGTGCARTVVAGHPRSMLYDPARVGGLPVTEGTSGPRAEVPPVGDRVENSDDGDIDRLSLLAVDDIEDFWTGHYNESLDGSFTPVSTLISYDSTVPDGPAVCGRNPYRFPNAMYCVRSDAMAWDRGKFLPTAKKYFGTMAINGVIAHEYGHAVQHMAKLVDPSTPVLVFEQQADCFAGAYLRWVAAGGSPRSTLSTGDGLNHVLAGVIITRDPISTTEWLAPGGDEHGTALDRVGAFQIGFDAGADRCAGIDAAEIRQRRGDLPPALFESGTEQSDTPVDEKVLSILMETLGEIFGPQSPPTLATGPADCPGAASNIAAIYCPAANTVVVDLAELQQLSEPSDQSSSDLPQGDNTAISIVTSRYALAVQRERGVELDSAEAAMRSACLTGVAQRRMAEKIVLPSGDFLMLAGGDLDEAVTGLLLNGLAASDVNSDTVPSGFARILAYRSGLHGDTDQCFTRFQ